VFRRAGPVLDRETVDGIIRKLMSIDQKLILVLQHLEEEDDDGQEDGS
jgi:hypothetical protein